VRAALLSADPQARLAVTGPAAIARDINAFNQADGERAEARALPLTLLILVLAFGLNLLGDALRDTLDPRLRGQE
jgi:uncharacterized membrane protein YdfJ with MMPL/SSD domain